MFDIRCETDLTTLLAQRQQWDAMAAGNIFQESSWLVPWWNAYGGNCSTLILTAYDQGGRLAGILPLYRDHRYGQASTLRSMGDGEACSDYTSVIAAAEDCQAVADAMADWLLDVHRDPHWGWNTIILDGVVTGDPAIEALLRRAAARGAITHQLERCSVWRRPLTDTWDEHVQSLSKARRRRTRRMCDTLARLEPDGPRTAETPEQLRQMLCVLEDLHQLRWAAVGRPGCFSSDRFGRFVRAMATDFFEQQRLRLCWLEVAGRPMAAELQVLGGGVLYCYTAGMDPDGRDLQAGHLLNISTARWAYENGIEALDFLRGDEPYKESWRATPRMLSQCRIAAPSLVPWMQHQTWLLGRGIKRWLKKTPSSAGPEHAAPDQQQLDAAQSR